MQQNVDENIAKVFGDAWTTKYHEAIAGKRRPRLRFENEIEENEFIAFLKEHISPEKPMCKYQKGIGEYDAIIVQTPQEIRVNPMKFGSSVAFRFGSNWISIIMNEDEVEKLVPNNTYVVAGQYKERVVGERTFLNFNAHYIKSMAELAEQKDNA